MYVFIQVCYNKLPPCIANPSQDWDSEVLSSSGDFPSCWRRAAREVLWHGAASAASNCLLCAPAVALACAVHARNRHLEDHFDVLTKERAVAIRVYLMAALGPLAMVLSWAVQGRMDGGQSGFQGAFYVP